MANSFIQPSFAGGEIAPTTYGRVDMAKYAVALRTCRNFIVRQYGGIENRPGARFLAAAKYSDRACRLIPFQFSTVQTYALEFGDRYMRVFKDGGPVLTTGGTVYELAMPYAAADLFKLKFTQSADVMTICHPDYVPRELRRYGHDNWQIVAVETKSGPFEDMNVNESVTVYSSGRTGNVTLTASSSIFKSYHAGKLFYMEQKTVDTIGRWVTGEQAILGSECRYQENYYRCVNAGEREHTGPVAPTHRTGDSWDGWAVDGSDAYGVLWRYLHSGFGICRISSVSADGFSATAAVITRHDGEIELPQQVVGIENATYKWAHFAWNDNNGYPGTVVYYQQRLFFAASSAYPQTIWGSRSGDYKDFGKSNPIQDDDRIIYTYAGRQVNEIRHLIDVGSLVALTSGGQFVINGDQNKVLTPSSFSFSSQGSDGATNTPPITVSNIALFIQEKGSVVRDLAYSFDVDGYQGSDLTILANHLFTGYQIIDWSYSTVPYSAAWCVRNDGMLLTLTYLRDQQVFAWAPQPTDGAFESTCSISEGTEDAVYFVVRRVINGVTRRYIERLNTRQFATPEDAFFVDSGLSYDGRNSDASRNVTISGGSGSWDYMQELTLTISGTGYFSATDVGSAVHLPYTEDGTSKTLHLTISGYSSANAVTVHANRNVPVSMRNTAIANWKMARLTFSGLDHLEGKAVSILSDANSEPTKTVTAGRITLENPGAVVHVGLPIAAEFETLDVNLAQQETLLDKKKLITSVSLVVNASRGILAGQRGGKMYEYAQREFEFYDDPVSNATAVIEVPLESQWGKNGRVYVQQIDPLPLSVLAVIPRLSVGGF